MEDRPELLGIARRKMRGQEMESLNSVAIATGTGLEMDYRGTARLRQVTILRVEDWSQTCSELGQDLPWMTRRANLLVRGLEPFGSHLARRVLKLGDDVLLETIGETEPCDLMERACTGLKKALTPGWRGGLFGRILTGGTVTVGDPIRWQKHP